MRKPNNSYIAGFIDGDGSIIAQIVRREDYVRKFQIRVSVVFYQKTKRHWFLEELQKEIGGSLRLRKDGMSELAIVGRKPVETILKEIQPYLRVKKRVAGLVLEIIKEESEAKTRSEFIEVCKKVDKVAEQTDSKKRTITAKEVEEESPKEN